MHSEGALHSNTPAVCCLTNWNTSRKIHASVYTRPIWLGGLADFSLRQDQPLIGSNVALSNTSRLQETIGTIGLQRGLDESRNRGPTGGRLHT